MPALPEALRPRQSGSIVINTAIALSLIVIALVGTELGYLFFMKRELQKTADLAAIAGASAVSPTDCGAARAAALANAAQNLGGFTPVVDCGRWDPAQDTERHFTANQTDYNAVHVVVAGAPPPLLAFFPGERSLRAEAVAAAHDPLAAFSVGSTLLRTGDSVLGDLLKGIGLDLTGTSLVGYDGLAQLQITPGGLLQALGIPVASDIGVGELNALLAAQSVQLGTLMDAIVNVAGQDGLLAANATLLNGVIARVGVPSLQVPLGSVANGPSGLFAEIVAPGANASSALNVGANALDLLYASIGVATQKHAVAVNGLGLAGLVSAKTVLIEPPSVAIGGVGATAYTAQLRTWIELDTSNLLPLGPLARVKLPIMIDLVNGRGTLTEMCSPTQRAPDGTERATIAVNASIAKVCVGRPGNNPANENQVFSTASSCDQNLADEDLLRIGPGGNLVSLRAHLKMDALPLQDEVTLAAGQTGTVGNNLLLGSTVQNITNALLATLLVETLDRGPALSFAQRQAMGQSLWNAEGAACGTRNCRINRLTTIKAGLENTTAGLGGFLGGLTGEVIALLGHTLSLNVQGLLTGVGSLVGGLLTGLGDVLGAVLGGLIGGCTAVVGSNDAACVTEIANSLAGTTAAGGDTVPNAITALAGYLLQALRPLLDGLGSQVLTPLLQNLLGLRVGEIDVNLQSLSCQARAHLVY
jgi:uncharacterized membrane protein